MNRSKAVKDGVFQPQTLDVDENIFDKNLKIVEDPGEKIFNLKKTPVWNPGPSVPAVPVTPTPGICVKTRNIAGEKVFINLCKIQEIPPPPPLSEEKLQTIIADEDYSTDFRVPMSIGAPRGEKDKSGGSCLSCDVAVNTVWFEETMLDSITFTTFVINLAMEGLCEKFGDKVNLDRQNWTILKNKKYLGTLQRHHIQQRANNPGPEAKIAELSASKPHCVITKETDSMMRAVVDLPGLVSKDGIKLDIGEDRVVLETSKGRRYELDIFLPFDINQDECRAQFNINKSQLYITMPILTQ